VCCLCACIWTCEHGMPLSPQILASESHAPTNTKKKKTRSSPLLFVFLMYITRGTRTRSQHQRENKERNQARRRLRASHTHTQSCLHPCPTLSSPSPSRASTSQPPRHRLAASPAQRTTVGRSKIRRTQRQAWRHTKTPPTPTEVALIAAVAPPRCRSSPP
jgi:RNase P protein component